MSGFELVHAAHLHPPYGLWIVRHEGVVIGRQLSRPSEDDCRNMLIRHREGTKPVPYADTRLTRTSYHLGGAEATLKAQRRGGHNRRKRGRPRKHE